MIDKRIPILLVTRSTRPQNLPEMFTSVNWLTQTLKETHHVIWYIGVDRFRKNPWSRDAYESYVRDCNSWELTVLHGEFCSKSHLDYGCSVAADIVKDFDTNRYAEVGVPEDMKDNTLCYLFDDDNTFNWGLSKCFEQAEFICPTLFSMRWKDGQIITPVQFLLVDQKNPEFCHGIDSAQFIIPLHILRAIGYYTGGLRIDQETIANAIKYSTSYKILTYIGAHYNAINSEHFDYDEIAKHPTAWYSVEQDKQIRLINGNFIENTSLGTNIKR